MLSALNTDLIFSAILYDNGFRYLKVSNSNRAICVLLGASTGKGNTYLEATRWLAKEMVLKRLKLVYGGSSVGLMGVLANEILENGGEVIGVITKKLYEIETAHINLTKLYVIDTMQERKMLMAQLSDACIAMPGGLGTLEELFEFWNAIKLNHYKKPLGLLNTDNYYKKMLEFMNHVMEHEFIEDNHLRLIKIADNPKNLIDSIFLEIEKQT